MHKTFHITHDVGHCLLVLMYCVPVNTFFSRLSSWFESLLSYSYTMGCPPVRGDNPLALASGLSYVQVGKHGITI